MDIQKLTAVSLGKKIKEKELNESKNEKYKPIEKENDLTSENTNSPNIQNIKTSNSDLDNSIITHSNQSENSDMQNNRNSQTPITTESLPENHREQNLTERLLGEHTS